MPKLRNCVSAAADCTTMTSKTPGLTVPRRAAGAGIGDAAGGGAGERLITAAILPDDPSEPAPETPMPPGKLAEPAPVPPAPPGGPEPAPLPARFFPAAPVPVPPLPDP